MARQITFTGQTTNAVAKELFQISGERFSIAYNASYRIRGTAIAQIPATMLTREWEFSLLIKNSAGTVSFVGYPLSTDLSGDTGTEALVLTLSADDTNKALGISVTGLAGTTINWSIGFDYDVLGYTPSASTPTSTLSVPQMIEMVKVHHPKVPHTYILKLLNTAQRKFIKRSRLNPEVSTISLASQTVVGTTKASPLVLTDGTYNWSFYKDATIRTLALKPTTQVLLYANISCVDSAGAGVNSYSISFMDDGTIYFFDDDGEELTDFDADAAYMTFEFVKTPDALTMSIASTPEIQSDYHDALAYYTIAELYPTHTELPAIERLQLSKHYKNLWDEAVLRARHDANIQGHNFSLSSVVSGEFEED